MMIKHFLTWQFVAFIAVGVTAASLHWLTRFILNYWVAFPVAVAIAYGVGVLTAFILNRIFVFPRSERPMLKQMRDFIIINLLFFPVVLVASIFLNNILPFLGIQTYTKGIAHLIAISIPIFGTFLIYKFFTFKEN